MEKCDIAIVGAGLVGLTFAFDLAQRSPNLKINVFTSHISADNKIYAISLTNIKYLQDLNIWPLDTTAIDRMNIYGDNNSSLILDRGYLLAKIVKADLIYQNLIKQIALRDNITIIKKQIDNIVYHTNQVEIIIGNLVYSALLLIGADGSNSYVRQTTPIYMQEYNYPQQSIVANFECELPHYNNAYQWFGDNGDVLAYLPLANGQISIVWSTHEKPAKEQLADLVRIKGRSVLGELELISEVTAFPIKLKIANQMYSNNVALIGDAAHSIHPLAGQGINLGFADSKTLAEILSSVKQYQLNDKALLTKYNSLRINQVKKMQFVCHALYKLFSNKQLVVGEIRNLGLNLFNNLTILKKYLINNAV